MNQTTNYFCKSLLSLAAFFFLFIIFSCNDNKSTSDTTATNNDTTLNDDCKIIFPTLRIDSSDFVQYYKKQAFFPPSSRHFRKLVFQFQLERYTGAPDTMRLICYALNKDRGTMHADTIPVKTLQPIVVQTFDGLLNLGNLELPNDTLENLIGKHNNVKSFTFLSLKPKLDPGHPHYILYEILVNNKVGFVDIVTNPCPPGSQN